MNKNRLSKKSILKKEALLIGQTLETKDKYLPHNKKTSIKLKDSRPVIIVDKLTNKHGVEEYAVIPGSTSDNDKHSTRYQKHGILRYRHNIEVRDDEGKPIQQNNKFVKTKNCTRIPEIEAQQIYNKVLYHTKFSSENKTKMTEFRNRPKKK